MSIVVKRLLKLQNEETPTRRKRVTKKALPALKAEQFISKKRKKTSRELETESSFKDKLLKSQYDAADAKLNVRAKKAKADFIEMNIGDTPERRAVRDAAEALKLSKKAEPSTKQLLLEYLRENEKTTKAVAVLKRFKKTAESRRLLAPPARASSVPASASVPAVASAIVASAVAASPGQVAVGSRSPVISPASTVPGQRIGVNPVGRPPKTAEEKLAKKEATRLAKAARRQQEVLTAASAAAPPRAPSLVRTPSQTRTLPTPPSRTPSAAAVGPAAAVLPATAVGPASAPGTPPVVTGRGFNRALIGKEEQLKAGSDKVYMSETYAHLDALNRHNTRTIIPTKDIVDVERFINTTLQNRAIPNF